jgi:ferric-dicitrate binding protein FerR (iron transport regulator)
MDCLSPEQLVAYLRTGNGEGRAIEAHVRECPGCAMEMLLARETLLELGPVKAARPSTARKLVVRRRSTWVPWAAAAGILLAAALIFALSTRKPDGAPVAKPGAAPRPQAPAPPVPKPEPEAPRVVQETPKPEPPKPQPPKPETPLVVQPAPQPPKPEPPKPETPVVVTPKPEPPKPEPTRPTVEKFAVGKVTHQVGPGANVVGKTLFSRETLSTARNEFVAFDLDGFGQLYFNQSTKAEIDVEGAITLHEGELLANITSNRRMAPLKTPMGEVQVQAEMFDVQATKASTEISVVHGRAAMGAALARGPALLMLRPGKLPEIKALEPGFAGWIPEKLASKRFAGWFEAEGLAPLNGFRVQAWDGASGERAAVQSAEQGTAVLRAPLPFKGRHAVWIRAVQHEGKPAVMGAHVGGQSFTWNLERSDNKLWRWVGPVFVNSDRLDLVVTALSRSPFQEGARTYPVVVDLVLATSDLKFVPAERLPEERRNFDFAVDEPAK